ncbi:MAG: hypothetical protein Q7R91_02535 [bacterium]|nr:hypothetical protein [bacterium]
MGMTGKYPPSGGWTALVPPQKVFDEHKKLLEELRDAEARHAAPAEIAEIKRKINYFYIYKFGYLKFPPPRKTLIRRLLEKLFS